MSIKNSNTTADYIEWNEAIDLVYCLFRDGKYRMSLLISCGIFFGLKISDLLNLSWNQILNVEEFELIEQKTNKRRIIRINKLLRIHIQSCYYALDILNPEEKCFLSQKKRVYSVQRINILLKEIKVKYGLKTVNHFSCHSLRKCFGRHIFEVASQNGQGEMALVMLSELFNHSSIAITKRYLGIRQEEILHCYDLLQF